MIYRISQKLSKKIKEHPAQSCPEHENPYLDWSAHVFIAARCQYILISNTRTLYSIVMPARGIINANNFIAESNRQIAEFMHADGFGLIYERIIEPNTMAVVFSKALNRSVTGYLNDFVSHAKGYLTESQLSLTAISAQLNDIPLLNKKYSTAREGFQRLAI